MADDVVVGGGSLAPIGAISTTPDSTPNPSPSGGAPNGVIDISDDTPIRGVPGFNEPVRYGDLYKRLNSDYTRKTQGLSKERQQFIAEREKYQNEIASERKRLEGLAQTLIARQSSGGGDVDPLFKELSSAPYIDGAAMGKFMSFVQEKGFAPVVKAFQERDAIIQNMYNQVLSLSKTVKELSGQRATQDFDGKINRWLSEGGYPPEAAQLAKEIYLAYEGDDLDNEFPALFDQRWNQLQNLLRAQDRKRVEDAKRQSTRLPGRGGNAAPGKVIGLKGHEKAKDVASALWDAMQTDTNPT